MKVKATYLFEVYEQNGPDSYKKVIEVYELENGRVFQKDTRGYFKEMERERFDKLNDSQS